MHASPRLARRASGAVFAVVALLPGGACSSSDDSPDARSEADATSTSAPPPLPGEEPSTAGPSAATADERFSALERDYAARLGVYAVDTGTKQEIEFRADERFAHASTFKALLCGVVLQQHSIEGLDEVIMFTSDDLVFHSPITETKVDTGMTIGELCVLSARWSMWCRPVCLVRRSLVPG